MRADDRAQPDATGLRIGMAVSGYHRVITDALRAGAADAFTRAGGRADDLEILEAPGAFELPGLCLALAGRDDVDGVVAIGCIIRGETSHDEHIGRAVIHGLTTVGLTTGKPVALGVLTCHTLHQARDRAGGPQGNKGEEAMLAVIDTLRTLASLRASPEAPRP